MNKRILVLAVLLYCAGLISGIGIWIDNKTCFDMGVYMLIFTVIIHIYMEYKKINSTRIYELLQQYIAEKNPEVKLYIALDPNTYQGQGLGKGYLRISVKWYEHVQQCPEHLEYIKCTICHELYHIKQQHPVIKDCLINIMYTVMPRCKWKDNYFILLWKEEFEADRYGYEIYENKELYIEKMQFMKAKSKYKPLSPKSRQTHPTWDMRISYLLNDIEPTLEQVTKEYSQFYKIRKR